MGLEMASQAFNCQQFQSEGGIGDHESLAAVLGGMIPLEVCCVVCTGDLSLCAAVYNVTRVLCSNRWI